ncbi:hypothetical protein AB4Z38_25265 [Arthrobacter sp. 2RAF6]|uniref:hypothetical protein n=1 Tax=Arthrobacter sp. 2RAF6 TaxID=3233002 RepID=UPI003F927BE5
MEKNTAQATASLQKAADELKAAQGFVLLAVLDARKSGTSWAAIGEILEISKQAAQQKYGPFVKSQLEAEARWTEQENANKPPEAATLVDEHVAGTSVTPSIFLEPKAPAPAPKPIYEPLPDYTNPHGWGADEWQQDNPKHFLVSDDKPLRPRTCKYCGQKDHRSNPGTWIYPQCTPTWGDPRYVLEK